MPTQDLDALLAELTETDGVSFETETRARTALAAAQEENDV